MKRIIAILGLYMTLVNPSVTHAANNKFGIHINSEHDLVDAARLVNSNGGEWGYVTLVIRDNEMDKSRWQSVFDQMRRLKLIPIVRLSTHTEGLNWVVPQEEDAGKWAEFLHSLNWPVKERYVVLFNEPNHAKEWGGKVDPVGYAAIVRSYETTLRRFSDDFKILPAALDLAAPNSSVTMEASRFWETAQESDTFLFTRFDYWNSHSYPNPGFSGDPTETGQQSIQGYKWELEYLTNLGLSPDIKVFITETGWLQSQNLDEERISENYKYAFENVWSDPQILAVTPFLLTYEDELFSGFSWQKPDKGFYKFFDTVASMSKEKGDPVQINTFELEKFSLAKQLVAQSNYTFTIFLKNTGQSIWNKENGFSMHYDSSLDPGQITVWDMPYTEPNQTAEITVQIDTQRVGRHNISLQFNKNGEKIGELITREFEILTPPSLEIKVLGWFGFDKSTDEYSLQIRDQDRVVLDEKNLEAVNGIASIPSLYNIIPNAEYKIRIARPLHLTKELLISIDPIKTSVDFGRLLPEASIIDFITNPLETQKLISPL